MPGFWIAPPGESGNGKAGRAGNAFISYILRNLRNLPFGKMSFFPILPSIIDLARKNLRTRYGKMTIAVPDDWVKNIRGNEKLRDLYVILRIPREISDKSWGVFMGEDRPVVGTEPQQESPQEIPPAGDQNREEQDVQVEE